jgi:predicted RNA binding protein YcfA (HicA-like mRNA interferase family)
MGMPLPVLSLTLSILCVSYTLVSSKDLIRELEAAGWVLDRIRGSHHVFKHPVRPGRIVVPHPKKDLGTGLVAALRKLK